MGRLIIAFVVVVIGMRHVEASGEVQPIYVLEVYATLEAPGHVAFDPFGNLYVGRGGPDPTPYRIRRVAPGGSPITEFGDSPIDDPDTVRVDVAGTISGEAGSVLVAGNIPGVNEGQIVAIHPDQSIHPVFGPTSLLGNPTTMRFDDTGRLLVADIWRRDIFVSTGETLSTLFSLPANGVSLAFDPAGRIFTTARDGVIRIHAPDGSLIDPDFASGLHEISCLEFGPGGLLGTDLYVIANEGNLYRFDELGSSSLLGWGFGPLMGNFTFGPDRAMYFPDCSNNRIYRLTVIPEPSTIVIIWSLLITLTIAVGWRKRRRK